jgi:hypothetical protein
VNDVEREGKAEDEEDADSPRSRVTNAVALGVQEDRGRRAAGHGPGEQELRRAQLHLTNLPCREAEGGVRGSAAAGTGVLVALVHPPAPELGPRHRFLAGMAPAPALSVVDTTGSNPGWPTDRLMAPWKSREMPKHPSIHGHFGHGGV